MMLSQDACFPEHRETSILHYFGLSSGLDIDVLSMM